MTLLLTRMYWSVSVVFIFLCLVTPDWAKKNNKARYHNEHRIKPDKIPNFKSNIRNVGKNVLRLGMNQRVVKEWTYSLGEDIEKTVLTKLSASAALRDNLVTGLGVMLHSSRQTLTSDLYTALYRIFKSVKSRRVPTVELLPHLEDMFDKTFHVQLTVLFARLDRYVHVDLSSSVRLWHEALSTMQVHIPAVLGLSYAQFNLDLMRNIQHDQFKVIQRPIRFKNDKEDVRWTSKNMGVTFRKIAAAIVEGHLNLTCKLFVHLLVHLRLNQIDAEVDEAQKYLLDVLLFSDLRQCNLLVVIGEAKLYDLYGIVHIILIKLSKWGVKHLMITDSANIIIPNIRPPAPNSFYLGYRTMSLVFPIPNNEYFHLFRCVTPSEFPNYVVKARNDILSAIQKDEIDMKLVTKGLVQYDYSKPWELMIRVLIRMRKQLNTDDELFGSVNTLCAFAILKYNDWYSESHIVQGFVGMVSFLKMISSQNVSKTMQYFNKLFVSLLENLPNDWMRELKMIELNGWLAQRLASVFNHPRERGFYISKPLKQLLIFFIEHLKSYGETKECPSQPLCRQVTVNTISTSMRIAQPVSIKTIVMNQNILDQLPNIDSKRYWIIWYYFRYNMINPLRVTSFSHSPKLLLRSFLGYAIKTNHVQENIRLFEAMAFYIDYLNDNLHMNTIDDVLNAIPTNTDSQTMSVLNSFFTVESLKKYFGTSFNISEFPSPKIFINHILHNIPKLDMRLLRALYYLDYHMNYSSKPTSAMSTYNLNDVLDKLANINQTSLLSQHLISKKLFTNLLGNSILTWTSFAPHILLRNITNHIMIKHVEIEKYNYLIDIEKLLCRETNKSIVLNNAIYDICRLLEEFNEPNGMNISLVEGFIIQSSLAPINPCDYRSTHELYQHFVKAVENTSFVQTDKYLHKSLKRYYNLVDYHKKITILLHGISQTKEHKKYLTIRRFLLKPDFIDVFKKILKHFNGRNVSSIIHKVTEEALNLDPVKKSRTLSDAFKYLEANSDLSKNIRRSSPVFDMEPFLKELGRLKLGRAGGLVAHRLKDTKLRHTISTHFHFPKDYTPLLKLKYIIAHILRKNNGKESKTLTKALKLADDAITNQINAEADNPNVELIVQELNNATRENVPPVVISFLKQKHLIKSLGLFLKLQHFDTFKSLVRAIIEKSISSEQIQQNKPLLEGLHKCSTALRKKKKANSYTSPSLSHVFNKLKTLPTPIRMPLLEIILEKVYLINDLRSEILASFVYWQETNYKLNYLHYGFMFKGIRFNFGVIHNSDMEHLLPLFKLSIFIIEKIMNLPETHKRHHLVYYLTKPWCVVHPKSICSLTSLTLKELQFLETIHKSMTKSDFKNCKLKNSLIYFIKMLHKDSKANNKIGISGLNDILFEIKKYINSSELHIFEHFLKNIDILKVSLNISNLTSPIEKLHEAIVQASSIRKVVSDPYLLQALKYLESKIRKLLQSGISNITKNIYDLIPNIHNYKNTLINFIENESLIHILDPEFKISLYSTFNLKLMLILDFARSVAQLKHNDTLTKMIDTYSRYFQNKDSTDIEENQNSEIKLEIKEMIEELENFPSSPYEPVLIDFLSQPNLEKILGSNFNMSKYNSPNSRLFAVINAANRLYSVVSNSTIRDALHVYSKFVDYYFEPTNIAETTTAIALIQTSNFPSTLQQRILLEEFDTLPVSPYSRIMKQFLSQQNVIHKLGLYFTDEDFATPKLVMMAVIKKALDIKTKYMNSTLLNCLKFYFHEYDLKQLEITKSNSEIILFELSKLPYSPEINAINTFISQYNLVDIIGFNFNISTFPDSQAMLLKFMDEVKKHKSFQSNSKLKESIMFYKAYIEKDRDKIITKAIDEIKNEFTNLPNSSHLSTIKTIFEENNISNLLKEDINIAKLKSPRQKLLAVINKILDSNKYSNDPIVLRALNFYKQVLNYEVTETVKNTNSLITIAVDDIKKEFTKLPSSPNLTKLKNIVEDFNISEILIKNINIAKLKSPKQKFLAVINHIIDSNKYINDPMLQRMLIFYKQVLTFEIAETIINKNNIISKAVDEIKMEFTKLPNSPHLSTLKNIFEKNNISALLTTDTSITKLKSSKQKLLAVINKILDSNKYIDDPMTLEALIFYKQVLTFELKEIKRNKNSDIAKAMDQMKNELYNIQNNSRADILTNVFKGKNIINYIKTEINITNLSTPKIILNAVVDRLLDRGQYYTNLTIIKELLFFKKILKYEISELKMSAKEKVRETVQEIDRELLTFSRTPHLPILLGYFAKNNVTKIIQDDIIITELKDSKQKLLAVINKVLENKEYVVDSKVIKSLIFYKETLINELKETNKPLQTKLDEFIEDMLGEIRRLYATVLIPAAANIFNYQNNSIVNILLTNSNILKISEPKKQLITVINKLMENKKNITSEFNKKLNFIKEIMNFEYETLLQNNTIKLFDSVNLIIKGVEDLPKRKYYYLLKKYLHYSDIVDLLKSDKSIIKMKNEKLKLIYILKVLLSKINITENEIIRKSLKYYKAQVMKKNILEKTKESINDDKYIYNNKTNKEEIITLLQLLPRSKFYNTMQNFIKEERLNDIIKYINLNKIPRAKLKLKLLITKTYELEEKMMSREQREAFRYYAEYLLNNEQKNKKEKILIHMTEKNLKRKIITAPMILPNISSVVTKVLQEIPNLPQSPLLPIITSYFFERNLTEIVEHEIDIAGTPTPGLKLLAIINVTLANKTIHLDSTQIQALEFYRDLLVYETGQTTTTPVTTTTLILPNISSVITKVLQEIPNLPQSPLLPIITSYFFERNLTEIVEHEIDIAGTPTPGLKLLAIINVTLANKTIHLDSTQIQALEFYRDLLVYESGQTTTTPVTTTTLILPIIVPQISIYIISKCSTLLCYSWEILKCTPQRPFLLTFLNFLINNYSNDDSLEVGSNISDNFNNLVVFLNKFVYTKSNINECSHETLTYYRNSFLNLSSMLLNDSNYFFLESNSNVCNVSMEMYVVIHELSSLPISIYLPILISYYNDQNFTNIIPKGSEFIFMNNTTLMLLMVFNMTLCCSNVNDYPFLVDALYFYSYILLYNISNERLFNINLSILHSSFSILYGYTLNMDIAISTIISQISKLPFSPFLSRFVQFFSVETIADFVKTTPFSFNVSYIHSPNLIDILSGVLSNESIILDQKTVEALLYYKNLLQKTAHSFSRKQHNLLEFFAASKPSIFETVPNVTYILDVIIKEVHNLPDSPYLTTVLHFFLENNLTDVVRSINISTFPTSKSKFIAVLNVLVDNKTVGVDTKTMAAFKYYIKNLENELKHTEKSGLPMLSRIIETMGVVNSIMQEPNLSQLLGPQFNIDSFFSPQLLFKAVIERLIVISSKYNDGVQFEALTFYQTLIGKACLLSENEYNVWLALKNLAKVSNLKEYLENIPQLHDFSILMKQLESDNTLETQKQIKSDP